MKEKARCEMSKREVDIWKGRKRDVDERFGPNIVSLQREKERGEGEISHGRSPFKMNGRSYRIGDKKQCDSLHFPFSLILTREEKEEKKEREGKGEVHHREKWPVDMNGRIHQGGKG